MPGAAARNAFSAILVIVSLVVVSATPVAPGAGENDEVRALWVVRTSLTSAGAIDAMVSAARAGGFNTLLVQVRGRGDAYFQGGVEPRPAALAAQPAFDPLATVIARAHAAGLQVHAWINVNLVAGLDLPSARDHVIYRHPEWLMVPRGLAESLANVDTRSPEYLGRLARYARARATEIEGLYLSPAIPAAADYTVAVVRDVTERYDVDGVHLDYIRYPEEDFDYGRATLDAFRQSLLSDLPAADRRRFDQRRADEPLVYTRAFPERWRTFRSSRLTALVARLRAAARASRPGVTLSAAVAPDPAQALQQRLQDWPAWLERHLIDVLCPMAYTTDAGVFASQIAAARELAGERPIWAGIGAYRLTPAQIVENVQTARKVGAAGIILFSYDSLADPARGPDYLARIGRAAFTQ